MSCANCNQKFLKKSGGYQRHSLNIKCTGSDLTVGEALEKVTGATFEECIEDEAETETSNENVQECPVQNEASSSSQEKEKEKLSAPSEMPLSSQKRQVKLTAQCEPIPSTQKKPVELPVQNGRRQSGRKRKIPLQYLVDNGSKPSSQKKQVTSIVKIEKELKRKKPSYFLCNRCYVHLSDCVKHEKALANFWGRHQEDSYIGERRGINAAEALDHNDHSYTTEEGQLHRNTHPVNDLKAPNYEAKRPKYTGAIKKNDNSKYPWQIKYVNKWDSLVNAIRKFKFPQAARKFYNATKGSRKGFLTVVGKIARRELRKLFEEETKFSLCSVRKLPNTENFWDKTLDQLKTEAPLLYTVLCSSVTSRKTEATLRRGNKSLKPQLGVALTCLMYTRAPTKLNSVTKYLCANFWRKRLRGELEKKPVAGNHSLCDVYPRQEILKISKEFQRAEEITQQHLEEEIIDKRKCIGNKAAMEVEDSDSDTEALEKVTGVTFEDYTEDEAEAETETSNENVEEYPVQEEASSSSQKNKEKLAVQNEPGPSNKKKKVKLNAQSKAKQSSPKKPVESVVQNESRRSSRKRHVENSMESESKPSTRKKKVQYSLQSESKSCSQKKQIDSTVQNEKEKRKKPLYFLCNRCYVHLSDCMRHEKAIADFWGRHQEDSYIGERRGVYAAELHYHNDHSYASKKGQFHRHMPPINDLRAPNYEAKRPKYTGSIKKNHLNNRSKNPWQIRVNKNNKWDTLVTAIRARQYRRAAKKFYSATKGSRKGFLTVVGIIARREIRKLFEEETKFSLCSVTDFPNTKDFWDKTLDQLKTEAPLLYTVLCSSVTSRITEATLLRGSTCLKPQLGVTLTCLMHTRAPRKLNSIAKYLCINFWRKRLRGELERKTVAGNRSLCDVYPRQEIVKISKDFQRAEKITQKHLEEEVIDNRRCIENEAAMEVEDFDFDNEDVVRYHKMAALTEVSSNKMFNGLQKVFSHESKECKCTMKFGVYLPPQAEDKKCPVLYWLSGLTCTEQNFVTKAGAQRVAAEKGIIIVAPDTSPRGVEIEGQDDSYDFGSGAGFYVDATEEKWKTNYRMYSYITSELPDLINSNFKTNPDKMSIFGHSMGGHGALICAMKNPGKYKSVSAFSPISNPINAPWGKKAFTGYLGEDQSKWQEYDATELVKKYNGPPLNILIDQGKSDNFYVDKQLLPENLVDACKSSNVPVVLRVQEGYDHSYYFIATFVEDHINHHAKYLCQ